MGIASHEFAQFRGAKYGNGVLQGARDPGMLAKVYVAGFAGGMVAGTGAFGLAYKAG